MPFTLQINGDIEQRIEALVSGLCWAEELGTSLEIYWWFVTPHVNVPFSLLFHPESLPSWATVRPGFFENPIVIKSQEDFLEKGYPTRIKSQRRFYEKDSEKWLFYLQKLRPSFALQQRISMTPTNETIGIYIHGLKESPISNVLTQIWTQHRGCQNFLLSTDCSDTKKFMQMMFKDHVFFTNPQAHPYSERYTIDRLVDLFVLSKCDVILDCTGSSLPFLSSQLGNKDILVLK
jgi:hypothetical protein